VERVVLNQFVTPHLIVLLWCGFLFPQLATAAPPVVTSSQVKEVAKDLVCLCGTCNRESLATCLCTAFAVPERQTIEAALAAGDSPQQIIESFVDRFGPQALAVPPTRGYALLAWIGPFVGLAFGLVLVRGAVVRWRRAHDHLAPIVLTNDASDDEKPSGDQQDVGKIKQRLERELDEFDSD
jgi:cytochrome c-type biogenesis protein CcmH/NrfF